MIINREIIYKLYKTSCIRIKDDNEVKQVEKDLKQIINWFSQLNEIETINIKPIFSIHIKKVIAHNDKVEKPIEVNEILKNSYEKENNFIVVPSPIR